VCSRQTVTQKDSIEFEALHQNRNPLVQEAGLSRLARVFQDPPSKIIEEVTSWCVKNSQGLYGNWLKDVTSTEVDIFLILLWYYYYYDYKISPESRVAIRVNNHLFVVTVPLTVDKELVLMWADGQVYDSEEVMSAKITHHREASGGWHRLTHCLLVMGRSLKTKLKPKLFQKAKLQLVFMLFLLYLSVMVIQIIVSLTSLNTSTKRQWIQPKPEIIWKKKFQIWYCFNNYTKTAVLVS